MINDHANGTQKKNYFVRFGLIHKYPKIYYESTAEIDMLVVGDLLKDVEWFGSLFKGPYKSDNRKKNELPTKLFFIL